mmetsp:Transcript_26306/g.81924  ORF Transcript_26306/g.81924 Transcript_26306/m.81924 type:complete len:486 (-) Transcript_26306:127-1584(-)
MDKILQSVGDPNNQTVTVTNDGATILRSIHVANPAAKILVEIAKTQDDEVGDGTTSVTVLCGELLREAELLVNQRVHPQTIIEGWRHARNIAREALERHAEDNAQNQDAFRQDLLNIAKTTLSSKLLTHEKDHFAELAVDSVLRLGGDLNLDYIHMIKMPGGQLRDSYLEEGFVLKKRISTGSPRRITNAKIMVANTPMDTDKIKIYGSRVRVNGLSQVAEIEEAERDKMREKCRKIIDHGINCFVNRQLIYNLPESILGAAGVMTIEHADFDGTERLAAVTGGEIVSTFDHPEDVVLGECDVIEEIMIGEDKVIRFGGCKSGQACTLVLRGASNHVLDEAERSLHDAICVLTQTLKETRTICGGGCTEMLMAQAIENEVPHVAGKASLAMEAFCKALRQMPTIMADNAGFDSNQLVTELRAAHNSGSGDSAGLDLYTGCVEDMKRLGIRESFKSKLQVLLSASEAAEMILRVDDVIQCAPRQRG